jgi:hypothetical protein
MLVRAFLLAALLAPALALALRPDGASACLCVAPMEETAWEDATSVFEGAAIARFDQAGKRITVFEVQRVWKGHPRLLALVWGTFSDPSVGTSCDVGFTLGQTYRVYAHPTDFGAGPDDPPALLRAGYCGTQLKRSALALPERAGDGVSMVAVRAAFAVFGLSR